MAVSGKYLSKIRRALREIPDDDFDQDIVDLIEECRRDLISLAVLPSKANSEDDPAVLGAIRSFVRWKYGLNNAEAAANREDYMLQRDEMRKRVDYVLEQ